MVRETQPSGSRLVIVSNRLPSHDKSAVGGLVSALVPSLEGMGEVVWFGWSGRTVNGTSRPRLQRSGGTGSLRLVGIDLPAREADPYYLGFCNGALWPLLHSFPERFRAEARDYACYRSVNVRFARVIARHLRPDDTVWVHDFHLIPFATELRRLGFQGPIGFFLHVPFPPHDVVAILPWAAELLGDLAAYDLVGFHARKYVENYEQARAREIGDVPDQLAGVYPIAIDAAPYTAWAQDPVGKQRGRDLRKSDHGRALVLAVDRLDYTKGVVERLRMLERFFELHSGWHRRVSVLQISAPTRTRVHEYARQRRVVEELVGHINGRFGQPDWVPIRYVFRAFEPRELAAFYREADVCLVTPLRDGMNLVAKEFVASQTGDPGVLILSRFAGAADELREALIVNPYDVEATAEELAHALGMPLDERVSRQAALLERVESQSPRRWRESFLKDLGFARRRRDERVVGQLPGRTAPLVPR